MANEKIEEQKNKDLLSGHEDIYELKLHQKIMIAKFTDVRRVPGGWIYSSISSYSGVNNFTSVFVPFNNEFMEADK